MTKKLEPEIYSQGRIIVEDIYVLNNRPRFKRFRVNTFTKRSMAHEGMAILSDEGNEYYVDLDPMPGTVLSTAMHGPLTQYADEATTVKLPLNPKVRWHIFTGYWDKYSNDVIAVPQSLSETLWWRKFELHMKLRATLARLRGNKK